VFLADDSSQTELDSKQRNGIGLNLFSDVVVKCLEVVEGKSCYRARS